MQCGRSLAAIVLVTMALATLAGRAWADDGASSGGAEAARHFDAGTAAFRRGDYTTAGREFDAAYAIAPHPDALWNAAQAWERAQDVARAANLYALFLELSPPDASDRDRANAAIARIAPRLARLDIHVEGDSRDGRGSGRRSVTHGSRLRLPGGARGHRASGGEGPSRQSRRRGRDGSEHHARRGSAAARAAGSCSRRTRRRGACQGPCARRGRDRRPSS